ncbi:MAG: BLUF domain-containing protein [Alphaproteobacteria bacterium]|nr:MAG: BLUF domain-containing protein [Alphaproteobacteria bacterium]
MIFTTVYVSTLHEDLVGDQLEALLEQSRASNATSGITGMLTVRGRRVMQMLEDEEAVVRELYARIAVDVRHTDVVTVWDSGSATRRFPDWSMAFSDLEQGADDDLALLWPEPPAPQEPLTRRTGKDATYIARRATALRRAMVSGDQLITSLAVILDGHRPEAVLSPSGTTVVRCAECRPTETHGRAAYPCNTARNAIWALESTQP